MHIFEELEKLDDYNDLVESIFAIVQPASYQKYKDKTDMQRMEEGVDEVVYHGEDDWSDIMQNFKEFGIDNVDPFGEGLKDALR